MKIPVLYLDTSVIGAYFDEEFQEATRLLWQKRNSERYRFVTSLITADELETAPKRVRELWLDTFTPQSVLDVTEEMEQLAAAYMERAIVTPKYTDDARHVAACTIARADYLVSWNFKHLVNVDREEGFNTVNLLRGYPPLRIISPLELVYGDAD